MTQVLIDDILPKTQIIATLGQTVFDALGWTADAASDVQVYQRADGVSANDVLQLLPTSAYNVTFIGASQTVRVTLITPAALNDVVTLIRATPADRLNLYTNTNFTPSMLNNDFGILTLVDQQSELVNILLNPRYNFSETVDVPKDIILPILGPNQFWAKDGADSEIVAIDITTIVSGGTVTQINTGVGLTGGPITNAGTISFAPIAANSFWANSTGGVAVPTVTSLSNFLTASDIGVMVQAYDDGLQSISGLNTVANNLIYTTAFDTYAVIVPANNSVLISSVAGVPSWNQTLPQGVQTNITLLGEQNQNLDMGGFKINDMGEPVQPSDAATKNYVDLNALTGTAVYAASAASLGTVTQSGSGVGATLTNAGAQAALLLDGVAPPLNSVVLIKDTATGMTAANEGIYTVSNPGSGATNWVLTRATTYDTPAEINQTGLIIVQNGSTLAGTAWYNAVTIATVDVTNFSYSQFGNIIFPVSLANGGTNANLTAVAGGIVYSTGTALAISAAGTAGQLLQSGGVGAPTWSGATFPTTAGAAGNVLISDGTDYVASTSLWPNTVGATGKIIRSNGTINTYSTATFADTYAVNRLLYASATDTVVGLATANSAVLVTGATGVPVWSGTMTNGQVIIGSTGATPVAASLTAGANITLTPGAGSLTISASTSFIQLAIRTFTSSGTYTPTTGMKYCNIECLGGGAAGGGAVGTGSSVGMGGGGGAGSYSRKVSTAATIGASQTVTIGAGGTPGAAGNNPGGNGGDTSVGALCIGKGGTGGGGNAGGGNIFGLGGAGGIAGTGDFTARGASGSTGIGGGTTLVGNGGQGASSPYGGGGILPGLGAGGAATGYGAGGGGAYAFSSSQAGGAGSPGIVIITEYI